MQYESFKNYSFFLVVTTLLLCLHLTAYAACEHEYGDYIITQQAGCLTTGSKYRVCKKCNYISTETIYPLGHDTVLTVVEPTCTEQGYKHATCSRSGCTFSQKYQYTEPLGHYLLSIQQQAPTCTQPGVMKKDCNRCDYFNYTSIAPLGHYYLPGSNTCVRCSYVNNTWSYMFKNPYMATHISQRFPNYDDGSYHKGIDIIDNDGDVEGYPIYSAYAGTVVYSFNDTTDGRGQFVEIQQTNGYTVRYLHMQDGSRQVQQGDVVSAGTMLGRVGETGWAYGAHLHFDVKNSSDAYVQPTQFFPNISFTYSY